MYELKKNGKVFLRVNFSSHEKNLPGHGLTKVEKHLTTATVQYVLHCNGSPSPTPYPAEYYAHAIIRYAMPLSSFVVTS